MNTIPCIDTIVEVLKDSSYTESYVWTNDSASFDAMPTLDKTDGFAMAHFIASLLKANGAPCVEEVIGLLEEFIQGCTATKTDEVLQELSVALNNAG